MFASCMFGTPHRLSLQLQKDMLVILIFYKAHEDTGIHVPLTLPLDRNILLLTFLYMYQKNNVSNSVSSSLSIYLPALVRHKILLQTY